MKTRLSRGESVSLCLFMAFWLLTLVLKIAGALHPVSQPVFVVTDDFVQFPKVELPLRPAPERASLLARGDLLVRIGDTDMRGKGQVGVLSAFAKAGSQDAREVRVEIERDGRQLSLLEPMPLRVPRKYLSEFVISIASLVAALIILLRARRTRSSRVMYQYLVADALIYLNQTDVAPPWNMVALTTGPVLVTLLAPLMIRAFQAFPEETKGDLGAWRLLPLAMLPLGVFVYSAFYGFPLRPDTGVSGTRFFVLLGTAIVLLVLARNFRRSSASGKRQVKWLVYSIYVAAMVSIPVSAMVDVSAVEPPLWATFFVVGSKMLFPVVVLIASLRFDLLDIDRLLGATVLYNVLAAIALGTGFLIVPRAADALTSGFDIGRPVAQVGLTLVLAALVVVVGRPLLRVVDRRFFSERYALEAAMRELPEQFASVRHASDLWELTGGQLSSLLRPVSLVIFTSAGDTFVPVYAAGEGNPPIIPANTPLLAWCRALGGATRTGRRTASDIGESGTALLEALQTQVVVPVLRKGELEAVICLGEKGSGDIYTPSDLALLTVIGKTLSGHMLRFDESELLERSRTMQERMRRYVPGALAEVIETGAELETGEREVSVLFVDIRGYTAYAGQRDAREIFSTINRYTEIVSVIVREEGGVVVEFNGDGMMAVFGAPRPLPEKEAAALRAGLRLATEVNARGEGDGLSVGVGIATGPAFVGNIEAVDRTIWSAIGNTTNFAARLQTMTRDLGASVLVDERTFTRAHGDAKQSFRRIEHVQVRGRAAPDTVYAFTLATPEVASPVARAAGA